jgi:secreted trypsin-like serine protease
MRPFFLYLLILLGFGAATSHAVTFGKEVSNASVAYPSVISIWYAETSAEQPEFLCTGTLINPRIVLTAAHCIYSTGLLYVKYGADQLDDDIKIYEVSASWRNPRFSERQAVNDVGLLLLTNPIEGARVTSLPAKSSMVKVQSNRSVKYEIVGWGADQNGDSATYLKRAAVDDQTAFAKKIKAWAPWRNDVWFAVGKYNSKEKVFAGSCNGDSGGPLFANLNGSSYLVGVTSWGAEDCELGAPSVYVRLSYYVDSIKTEGIRQLYVNEVKQNRSRPSVVTEPKIEGAAKGGNTVTCNKGVWSANTTNVSVEWTQDFYTISNNEKLTIPANSNSQKKYICEVTASNGNGAITRSLEIVVQAAPQTRNAPILSGMPSNAEFTGESVVKCSLGTFDYAESVSNEWWVGASSFSEPSEKIGSGPTLTITTALSNKYFGKYLFCKSIAQGEGGASSRTGGGLIFPSIPKPSVEDSLVITGMPKDGYSVSKLNQLICSGGKSSGQVTSTGYSWLLRTSSSATTGTIIGYSQTISLSSDWFKENGSKNLVCKFTAIGPGGENFTQASANVFAPQLHRISSVSVKGIPECYGTTGCDWVGIKASCEASSTANSLTKTAYSWRIYALNVPYYPLESSLYTEIGTSKDLVLTEAILKQAVLRKIGCAVSYSTEAGTASGYSTATYIDYRNISVADTTAPQISLDSIIPYNGTTISLGDPFTIKFSAKDSSGIPANRPFSFRFIYSGTSEVNVTTNGSMNRVAGDATYGIYEQSFIIPSIANGGKSGSYQVLIFASDSKSNSTGWINLGTFEVTAQIVRAAVTPPAVTPPTVIPPAVTPPTVTPPAAPTGDKESPVGSNWSSPSYSYPGGSVTVSFKATDNIGVTKAQIVLTKGADVLTTPAEPLVGFPDFYKATFNMPSNASGSYGIRFEAFDAAGNKYSFSSSPTPVMTDLPVYLGGASVIKSGDPNKLASGDVFTCNIGNWGNNSNVNTPVTCEWVTGGPRVRGLTYTITNEMAALTSYWFNVILRVSGNSQVDGYWINYFMQMPGGLEGKSDISLYSKTFTK